MNFFELETLAPMRVSDGVTTGSSMTSETHFYRGDEEAIKSLLQNEFCLDLAIFY